MDNIIKIILRIIKNLYKMIVNKIKSINVSKKTLGVYTIGLIIVFGFIILVTSIALIIPLFSDNIDTIKLSDYEIGDITDSQDLQRENISDQVHVDLNPGDNILKSMYSDEVLPVPYSANFTYYIDFATDIVDNDNDGKRIIVIDPGHQNDTIVQKIWLSPYLNPEHSSSWVEKAQMKIGTRGVSTKIYEYETTLVIAKKLKKALEDKGYTVILTKESVNEKLNGPQRAAVANKSNADLMISLHFDANSDKSIRGASILCPIVWEGYPSDRLAYRSMNAGSLILNEYCEATKIKNRGVFELSQVSMFSFCKTPCILLEMGFFSNITEDKYLNDSANHADMVKGIVNGVEKYFELLN